MKLRLVAVVAVFALMSGSSDAATYGRTKVASSSMGITYESRFTAYFQGYGYMIEQQTPLDKSYIVVNPYPRDTMLWDVDDLRTIMSSGSLGAGQTFTIDIPAVLDSGGHLAFVTASAGTKGGTVSFSIPALGWTYTRPLTRAGQSFCLIGPYFDLRDTRLVPIAGSNGGVGLVTSYRVTITSSSKVHSAGLSVQIPYASLSQQQSLCGGTNWYDIGGPMALVGP